MTVSETCSCLGPMGKIDRPGEGVSFSLLGLAGGRVKWKEKRGVSEGRVSETERGLAARSV